MSELDRRTFLKLLAASAAAGSLPWLSGCEKRSAPSIFSKDFYKLPMTGNARVIHMTDAHGQLNPVYFREPNVNLGVGDAYGRPPHVVGNKLLDKVGLKHDSPESYAYTYIDFDKACP